MFVSSMSSTASSPAPSSYSTSSSSICIGTSACSSKGRACSGCGFAAAIKKEPPKTLYATNCNRTRTISSRQPVSLKTHGISPSPVETLNSFHFGLSAEIPNPNPRFEFLLSSNKKFRVRKWIKIDEIRGKMEEINKKRKKLPILAKDLHPASSCFLEETRIGNIFFVGVFFFFLFFRDRERTCRLPDDYYLYH